MNNDCFPFPLAVDKEFVQSLKMWCEKLRTLDLSSLALGAFGIELKIFFLNVVIGTSFQ